MMQVWFLFKIIETIIGSVCVAYHALGFTGKEPLPHILIFCGTFFGFSIMSLTGAIALAVGAASPALTEFIINFIAAVLYYISSIVSMHYAEIDFHLMYLSDFEEPEHPYFELSRAQSISALAAGSLHLLHAVLAFDAMFGPKAVSDQSDESTTDTEIDDSDLTHRPIRMYFLSKAIEQKMRRFKWFDHMCKRSSPALSIFSFAKKSRGSVSSTHSNKSTHSKHKKSKDRVHELKEQPANELTNEPTAATANPLDLGSTDEEESVTKIQYSDFRPQPRSQLTLKNEKASSESAMQAISKSSNDDQKRASLSSYRSKASTRFLLPSEGNKIESQPSVPTQSLPSILRKDSSPDTETTTQMLSQKSDESEPIGPIGTTRTYLDIPEPKSKQSLQPPTPPTTPSTSFQGNDINPSQPTSDTGFPHFVGSEQTESYPTSVSSLKKFYESKIGVGTPIASERTSFTSTEQMSTLTKSNEGGEAEPTNATPMPTLSDNLSFSSETKEPTSYATPTPSLTKSSEKGSKTGLQTPTNETPAYEATSAPSTTSRPLSYATPTPSITKPFEEASTTGLTSINATSLIDRPLPYDATPMPSTNPFEDSSQSPTQKPLQSRASLPKEGVEIITPVESATRFSLKASTSFQIKQPIPTASPTQSGSTLPADFILQPTTLTPSETAVDSLPPKSSLTMLSVTSSSSSTSAEQFKSKENLLTPDPYTTDDKKLDDAEKPKQESTVSIGLSAPSLAYTDHIQQSLTNARAKESTKSEPTEESVRKVSTGTSIPSLAFTEDDESVAAFQNERSHYFTPKASEESIANEENQKSENKKKKPPDSSPPQPPPSSS